MTATSSATRRVAATLLGSGVLLAAVASLPAYAAPADANAGEIKVTFPGDFSEVGGARPRIPGCQVQINLEGYDLGTETLESFNVEFTTEAPSGGVPTWTPASPILGFPMASGRVNGFGIYSIDPAQVTGGSDLRLRATVTRTQVDVPAKTRVFELTGCGAGQAAPVVDPGPAATSSAPAAETAPATPAPAFTPAASATPHQRPVKVNAGGESGNSGLIVLGVAGVGVAAAAGYGLSRGRRRA